MDISYIWRAEGWLYLAIVLGFYSRRIVGWATSDRLKKGLALTALNRAIAITKPEPGLIHHSDRSSQSGKRATLAKTGETFEDVAAARLNEMEVVS